MLNVNHRYSSESWNLDLSAKRSPLSRWTGQDLLRNEQFRLSLLGAQAGIAPVVWLSGDRPCFEALHNVVEAYVQKSLGVLTPAGQSTFHAGTPDASVTSSASDAPAPSASNHDSQFSLEALDQLHHSLNYSPNDGASPRQMQLSTLQLADLLAVLDQWQTEILALPESSSKLRILPGGQDDFVIPTWGRIAASLVVAVGATGLGAYLLSQRLPGEQVAMESRESAPDDLAAPNVNADATGAFGSFPTASGPPITSQAQDGDAPFNNPLLPPEAEPALTLPGELATPPPNVTFPTPLPGELVQVPLPPATTTFPDVDVLASAEIQATADIQSTEISPPDESEANLFPEPAIAVQDPLPENDPPTGFSAADMMSPAIVKTPSGELSVDSPLLDSAANVGEGAVSIEGARDLQGEVAEAPALTAQPNLELAPASPEAAQAKTIEAEDLAPLVGAGTVASVPISPSIDSPATSPSAVSRVSDPSAVVIPSAVETAPLANSAPTAPPVAQVTVAQPLPANNQSRAVQSYLQSQWKPPTEVQQPLQYRLNVSSEGTLSSVEALSPTAQLYVDDTNLPSVGSTISGATDTVQSTMVVTLTPAGEVNVAVEKATPAP